MTEDCPHCGEPTSAILTIEDGEYSLEVAEDTRWCTDTAGPDTTWYIHS